MDSVTFRIPATTANLGPGYDALGVALRVFNQVTVTRDSSATHDAMPATAAKKFFERAKTAPFSFAWKIEGEVPRSRGLGSSVTVRLGLLASLNELAGVPLDRTALFQICAELEGHPDNAAPAAFGGFTVAGGKKVARFEVGPELHFVMLIPDFEIATPAAFASRDYEMLAGAFEDHLHQPYREKALIPFLTKVITAGENAGALGGFLSGSGSTICCVTLEDPDAVMRAMIAAAPSEARGIIVQADNCGAGQV